MATSPALFYDIAAEALAAAVDALHAALPERLWHTSQGVVNGPPAWDGWEGCAVAVLAWVEYTTPTLEPPAPSVGLVVESAPWPMVQVVVSTVRCEPTIDTIDKAFPTSEELDDSARVNYVDGFVVWNALARYALAQRAADDDDPADEGYAVAMGLSTPVPAAGGLVGWETRLVVIPTDPSCPPADLAELDDEWWPPAPQPGY